MKLTVTPLILFTYNRPGHLFDTLNCLKTNKPKLLYAYSDAPKNKTDIPKVQEVRTILRSIDWTDLVLIERETNIGLAASITSGVTEVLAKHGKAIILEDDLVVSPGFYSYMSKALNLYENEEKVMHIAGYMFPLKNTLPDTLFYNVNSCWGWATWKRAWDKYTDDTQFLFNAVKKLDEKELKRFNGGQNNSFFKQLAANASGTMNTWAVKWHTSIFLNEGFCLHPGKSLVNNIGHDGTGTYSGKSRFYQNNSLAEKIHVEKLDLVEHPNIHKLIKTYYFRHKTIPSLVKRSKIWLSRLSG